MDCLDVGPGTGFPPKVSIRCDTAEHGQPAVQIPDRSARNPGQATVNNHARNSDQLSRCMGNSPCSPIFKVCSHSQSSEWNVCGDAQRFLRSGLLPGYAVCAAASGKPSVHGAAVAE